MRNLRTSLRHLLQIPPIPARKKHCAAGKFPNAARIESIREVDSDLYYIDCTRFPFGGLLIELKACGDEKNHAYLMIVMSVAEDHEQRGIVQTNIPAI